MTTDPFDDLLDLENDYYKEGYDAGVADSAYAGMIEGKVFGIEKGYEKALELGKLHGRALVWEGRFPQSKLRDPVDPVETEKTCADSAIMIQPSEAQRLREILQNLAPVPENGRLRRHLEALFTMSDGGTVARDNSDHAVTEFDDRIARANAKAKVIANIVGESLKPTSRTNVGIEDATGLHARR